MKMVFRGAQMSLSGMVERLNQWYYGSRDSLPCLTGNFLASSKAKEYLNGFHVLVHQTFPGGSVSFLRLLISFGNIRVFRLPGELHELSEILIASGEVVYAINCEYFVEIIDGGNAF